MCTGAMRYRKHRCKSCLATLPKSCCDAIGRVIASRDAQPCLSISRSGAGIENCPDLPQEDSSYVYFCKLQQCLMAEFCEQGLLENKQMEADLRERGYRATRTACPADMQEFRSLTNGSEPVYTISFLETWLPVLRWNQALASLPPRRRHFNYWNSLVDEAVCRTHPHRHDRDSLKRRNYFLASKRKCSDPTDTWTMHYRDYVPCGAHYIDLDVQ